MPGLSAFLGFHYNLFLVALSIGVATFAAYTAFDITECATQVRSWKHQILWVALGGFTLGGGIWSMHFIGMLALHLDIPVRYDLPLTLASLAIADIAAGFALFQVAQPIWNWSHRISGAVIMGGAVAMMHYIGMTAIRIPATMEMDHHIIGISVLIAIGASGAAQWILRRFDQVSYARELWRWCASFVMGLAVSAMHYTAMYGVRFIPEHHSTLNLVDGIEANRLAELVGAGTLVFCGITLVITLSQRRRALQASLLELQNAQMRLIQAEKLSSVGQLSAGISHEINNPLAFLKGNLSYLELTMNDLIDVVTLTEHHTGNQITAITERLDEIDWDFVREDLPKSIQSMHTGIARIQDIVKSLEVFSSCNESEIKSVNLCARIDDALKLLSQRLAVNDNRPEIIVERNYEELPSFECLSGEMLQAIFSFLDNAIDAIEQRWKMDDQQIGKITITTRLLSGQNIYLSITDNGIGFDAKLESRLFEPFFTTKAPGKGTGLGLTLALQTIQQHGGTLSLLPTQSGTRVEITLPVNEVGTLACELSKFSVP
jgi:NO-binding membrane sensor protein with MHYT domain